VTPDEYRALQRLADVPRGMAKTLIQAYGFTQRAQTIATCAVSPMNRMARALVDGRCFARQEAGGATPGPSVQQWAADLIAHAGSDPVHQSFVPALRSDQPNSRYLLWTATRTRGKGSGSGPRGIRSNKSLQPLRESGAHNIETE
jgi:hypothetical protein